MNNLYQFLTDRPIISLLVLWLICETIFKLGHLPVLLGNRGLRHLNIRKQGWPPPHCDADGDAVETETKEQDAKI